MLRQAENHIVWKSRMDSLHAWWPDGTKVVRLFVSGLLLLGNTIMTQAAIAGEQTIEKRVMKLGLPPISSLTVESDYTLFMRAGVPDDIRVIALRKLWSHPMFKKIDELDTYAADFHTDRMPLESPTITTAVQPEALATR